MTRGRSLATAPDPRRRGSVTLLDPSVLSVSPAPGDESWIALVASLRTALLADDVGADAAELRSRAMALVAGRAPLVPRASQSALADEVVAAVAGLGPLEALLADETVTDVMVNASSVWVERFGQVERTDLVLSPTTVAVLIERIVGPLGLRVDRTSPAVDARLPDGSRVHAIVGPLAVDGPHLTIRRFAARPVPLEAFCDADTTARLSHAVRQRRCVIVCGGTGSGKTTLLNALGAEIDPTERIITIEDAAELRLPGEHVVRLEARPPNADGYGGASVRDLVRHALRMRPDRIVVGEVRGGEALDMVQAMNTGHSGSLATCHANGPLDALRRLEVMVLLGGVELPLAAVWGQLASALDLVVHVKRLGSGERHIVDIQKVVGGASGLRCEEPW